MRLPPSEKVTPTYYRMTDSTEVKLITALFNGQDLIVGSFNLWSVKKKQRALYRLNPFIFREIKWIK